jgi:hypothetical protein
MTYLISRFIGDLYSLHASLSLFQSCREWAVEVAEHGYPRLFPSRYLVQILFHAGGESHIHDVRKVLREEVAHHLTEF